MPLIVHSTWRAPFCTPASELATARPRSLWQWVEMVTFSMPATLFAQRANELAVLFRHAVADGVGDVNGGGTGGDYGFDDLAQKWNVGAGRVFG